MGVFTKLFGSGGGGGSGFEADQGMAVRAGMLRDAQDHRPPPRPEDASSVNVWRWSGTAWTRWSAAWQDWDDVAEAEVPETLLDVVDRSGAPESGACYRFDDGEWKLVPPPDGD